MRLCSEKLLMKSIISVDYVGFVWQAYWGWFGISIRDVVLTLQWMAEEQIPPICRGWNQTFWADELREPPVITKLLNKEGHFVTFLKQDDFGSSSETLILWRISSASTETSPTRGFGVDWGVGVAGRVRHACPPPPEEATQDAALERLQQGALPRSGVSEQFQFNPGLDGLSGP